MKEAKAPMGKSVFFKTDVVDVCKEDFLTARALFPMLQKIDGQNEDFIQLVSLIKEMANAKYEPPIKYQLICRIVKIGNLLKKLLPELKTKSSVDTLANCLDGTPTQELNHHQQWAVLYLARNIAADFFHVLYEKKISTFIEDFSALVKGTCSPVFLSTLHVEGNDATRGKDVKKYLSDEVEGKKRINKLLCQIGYFLMKAQVFFNENNIECACMALIGAGSCARDFNFSTLNPKKNGSVMAELATIRSNLSHIFEEEYNDAEFIQKLKDYNMGIPNYLFLLENEAKLMGNPIDCKAYYEAFVASESPRAYDLTRFEK